MVNHWCMLLLSLLALAPFATEGCWLFSPHRKRNCRWGGWSSWSRCSQPCGTGGTQWRHRGIAESAICGGSGCSGPRTQSRSCNRFCRNGGAARTGYCSCPEQFWNTCCDRRCTPIRNCERLYCTTGTNQECRRCMYDRGGKIRAYRPISSGSHKSRTCQQLCSWRPDSSYCFPGICKDVPNSCECADGFNSSTSNCMTITRKPEISPCVATVEKVTSGKVQTSVDVPCDTPTPRKIVYTNLHNRLIINWQSRFIPPSLSEYPKPYYVQDFKTGIVKAQIKLQVDRGAKTMHKFEIDCSHGYSVDKPNEGNHSCNNLLYIGFPVAHKDKLVLTMTAYSGGYVKLNNYDKSSKPVITAPKYYTGSSLSHRAVVHFDFVPPIHCSVRGGCTNAYLDVGPAYTKKGKITVSWSGWNDLLSGVMGYELDVYKMHAYGDVLRIHLSPHTHRKETTSDKNEKFELQIPGLYCFLLTVIDVAGNRVMARKFVLYDKSSKVQVLADPDKAMVVQSAAVNTSHTWITDLTKQVKLSWKKHFINKFHHKNKLLNAIAPHSPPLSAKYEDRTGLPPNVRSMQPIPNVQAVTSYDVQVRKDRHGGRKVTGPMSDGWINVTDFQSEQVSLDVPRSDGDSIRLFVRGWDVMENQAMDSIVVHVDSSPPKLMVMGLAKGRQQGLIGDKLNDFFDIKLDFEAIDPHSGLHSISYKMHAAADSTRITKRGNIPVNKKPVRRCHPPVCTCVPATGTCYSNRYQVSLRASKMAIRRGQKEVNYYFTISVTNNARLVTTKKYRVQCDIVSSGANSKRHLLRVLAIQTCK